MTQLEFLTKHARWLAAQLESTLVRIDQLSKQGQSAEQSEHIAQLELQLAQEREEKAELQSRHDELGRDWEELSGRLAQMEAGGMPPEPRPKPKPERDVLDPSSKKCKQCKGQIQRAPGKKNIGNRKYCDDCAAIRRAS